MMMHPMRVSNSFGRQKDIALLSHWIKTSPYFQHVSIYLCLYLRLNPMSVRWCLCTCLAWLFPSASGPDLSLSPLTLLECPIHPPPLSSQWEFSLSLASSLQLSWQWCLYLCLVQASWFGLIFDDLFLSFPQIKRKILSTFTQNLPTISSVHTHSLSFYCFHASLLTPIVYYQHTMFPNHRIL